MSVVRYYGRNSIVPCDSCRSVIDSFGDVEKALAAHVRRYRGREESKGLAIDFLKYVSKQTSLTDGLCEHWEHLRCEIVSASENLSDVNHSMTAFKLEILRDGLLPYIRGMPNQSFVSASRFRQVATILSLLTKNEDVHLQDGMVSGNQIHPSLTLVKIESVIRQIDRNSKFDVWESGLSKRMTTAVNDQWTVILGDIKSSIQSVSSKLVILGLLETVGRPLAMLYPLWSLGCDVMKAQEAYNNSNRNRSDVGAKQFSIEHIPIPSLIKAAVMLLLMSNLLRLVSIMSGVGIMCLLLGVCGLALSTCDPLLKYNAHLLAPHLAQLDTLVSFAITAENTAFTVFGSAVQQSATSPDPISSGDIPDSGRVDVLSDTVNTVAVNDNSNVASGGSMVEIDVIQSSIELENVPYEIDLDVSSSNTLRRRISTRQQLSSTRRTDSATCAKSK